ncbi:MAG: hypothetical protein P8176_09570 [Gammaproteobacteria bacterium]
MNGDTTDNTKTKFDVTELKSIREKVSDLISLCDQKESQLFKTQKDLIDCYETIGNLLDEAEGNRHLYQELKIKLKTIICPSVLLARSLIESIAKHEQKLTGQINEFKAKAIENAMQNIDSAYSETQSILEREKPIPISNHFINIQQAITELITDYVDLGKTLNKPIEPIIRYCKKFFLTHLMNVATKEL